MEIKITCPDCGKEIKILLHMVDKLKAENERLRYQLQQKNKPESMPEFFREIFK